MKKLSNQIIIISAFLFTFSCLFSSFPAQAECNKCKGKIRVVNIDASKYQNQYDDVMNTDPWKGFNTAMFKFNNALDQYFIAPLARGYRFAMPEWGRDRVHNFVSNLREPANLLNGLMQGDIEAAFRAFWRFAINTTFGIGGLHDVAGGFNLAQKTKPFSQTLMIYGVDTGPYLVMPFIGPSTPRDFVSEIFDEATDPTTYVTAPGNYAFEGLEVVSARERILDYTDDVQRNSFDVYSTYKSSYTQHRKEKILKTLE